jgi:hypothetical protein
MAKKATLESLAKTVNSLIKTVDSLAVMTKRGFDELREEVVGARTELRTEMRAGFTEVNERLDVHGDELDNANRRVKRLEKFTGIDK